MFRMSKRLTWFLVGSGLCLAITGVSVFNLLGPTRTVHMHGDFVADFSDDRALVGVVHHIFIGRVIAQSGTKALGSIPETQFQVEVLENIKGQLSGTVVVNQEGGYQGNNLILFEGDKLLLPGETYFFATRVHEAEGWHTVVPRFGDIILRSADERSGLIARFKKVVQQ